MNKKIRTLKPTEIEVRIAQVMKNGVQLLLYKDSRCDKRILDETFGINGWQNYYQEIKGNLFCTIQILDDEKKEWISKQDCGVESFSEKEKGEASDAFKRAGFNVGIGRELYTRIFYFANVPTQKNEKGKYELVDKNISFHVTEIETNEETEKIEKIKIADNKEKIVFTYGYPRTNNVSVQSNTQSATPTMITATQIKQLQTILGKKEGLKETVYKQMGISSSKELTYEKAKALIADLNKKVK